MTSLSVYAALNLYASTPEEPKEKKDAALQRLIKIATFLTNTWPQKPEADDARIALGNSHLVGGRIDEALKVFENVNPKSERYATGLYLRRPHVLGTIPGREGETGQQGAGDERSGQSQGTPGRQPGSSTQGPRRRRQAARQEAGRR